MTEIETIHAEKRLGYGKLTRRIIRLWCRLTHHKWMPWHFDWPYDDPEIWDEMGEAMRDPEDDEVLLWVRGCNRDCGTIETARVTLRGAYRLPGVVLTLEDNPIRQNYYWR